MSANLLVAHGGGPTAVINASLAGVVEQALGETLLDGIFAARFGIEGVLKDDLLDLRAENKRIWREVRRSPASAVGSCRRKLSDSDYERILDVFRAHEIRYFLYTGGNDSMDTADKIARLARAARYDICVAGIPKTVDNDLSETDHCPGYASAARFFAQATYDVGRDLESLPTPVSVMEVMGRNAGWLTAAAALARETELDAPHLVYFPEVAFEMDRFLTQVEDVYKRLGFVVIAASEGLKGKDGTPVYQTSLEAAADGFGHVLPGNVGQFLADAVSAKLRLRARSEKPGLIARTATYLVSDLDQTEAYRLGRAAVAYVLEGNSGDMMTIVREFDDPYRSTIGSAPLSKVANVERKLPREFIGDDGVSVSAAFARYALPLIGAEIRRYPRLVAKPVEKRT
ncbi:MAG: 6-phosphofructokinase [Planctomycetota bacterium]